MKVPRLEITKFVRNPGTSRNETRRDRNSRTNLPSIKNRLLLEVLVSPVACSKQSQFIHPHSSTVTIIHPTQATESDILLIVISLDISTLHNTTDREVPGIGCVVIKGEIIKVSKTKTHLYRSNLAYFFQSTGFDLYDFIK